MPWLPLRQLSATSAASKGAGFAQMTTALPPKCPALILMPGSVVPASLLHDLGAPRSVRRARAHSGSYAAAHARPEPQPGGGASGPARALAAIVAVYLPRSG